MRLGFWLLCLLAFAPRAHAGVAEQLKGDWVTGWIADPNGFVQSRFKLSFAERTCKIAADALVNHPLGQAGLRLEMNCEYTLGGASTAVPGATELDFKLLDQRMTLLVQSMVDDYNEDATCGYTDWRLGVPKDVTGRDCDGDTFVAGSLSFDIVRPNADGSLNMGVMPDNGPVGTSADDRPTALDLNRTYYRPGSEPSGGTGTPPPPDVLPGFYRVLSHTANAAACDREGPAAAALPYFEIYANSSVVLGVPGWSVQACDSPDACRQAPNQILLRTPWPVHEDLGEGRYAGKVVQNSWFGTCNVELNVGSVVRADDGSLTLTSRTYKGTVDGTTSADDCTRKAHDVDPLSAGFACSDYHVMAAKPVEP